MSGGEIIGFSPLDRLHWLAVIAMDARITIGTLRVAASLAERMNGKTGQLNPSAGVIAEDTGMTDRTVKNATKTLVEFGYIEKKVGGGSGKTNNYILKKSEPPCTVSNENSEPLFTVSDKKGCTTVPKRVNHCDQKGCTTVHPEHSKEQGKNTSAQKCANAQKRFPEFWAAYPKKEDKIKARKVWESKKLDPRADHIIADIQNRLARDRQWQDEQYIPYPTTYLRNERWEDETEQVNKPKRKGRFVC